MTLETDSASVQALDTGYIIVNINGVNTTELINKAAESDYSLRMMDGRDSTETSAIHTNPHRLLQDNTVIQDIVPLITETVLSSCTKQAREDVPTLHHLQLPYQDR